MFNLLALNDVFCSSKQTQTHNLCFQKCVKGATEQKVAQKQAAKNAKKNQGKGGRKICASELD